MLLSDGVLLLNSVCEYLLGGERIGIMLTRWLVSPGSREL